MTDNKPKTLPEEFGKLQDLLAECARGPVTVTKAGKRAVDKASDATAATGSLTDLSDQPGKKE